MTFCDNMLKSFSENLKQLTKINDFLLFLHFHENRRILHCFLADMNFACKNKCMIIECTISANFIKGYSLTIQPNFSRIIMLYLI